MTVLVLTHDGDTTADRVIAELAVRGVPVARLDQAQIPMQVAITGRIRAGAQWSGNLRDRAGHVIDLASVRVVWHRHTRQFVVDERMSGPERAFAYGEARRGYGGILASLDGCLRINDPMAAARAEYKPVQLAAATAVGLRIPDTIITKAFEARAIVVADGVYAVRIDAGSDSARQDWRSDYDALTYTQVQLPDDTAAALVALCKRLGLVYGAVDLICRPSGEWVFLEVNQAGEWGWLAEGAGIPVAGALADLMTSRQDARC